MINIRQEKCPTDALKKFRKHETVNPIRLNQTVKTNTMDDEHNEHTEETIKRAEKDFALDLPVLVEQRQRSGGPVFIKKLQRRRKTVPAAEPQVRTSQHNYRPQRKTSYKFCPKQTKKFNWTSPVQ